LVERATRWFERLGPSGKIAVVAGAVVACGIALTIVTALVGGESGASHPSSSSTTSSQEGLRGSCTLSREDGTLEQITLTGRPVSRNFCQAFASYLEETVGVEEHTWSARATARPLRRHDCASCSVKPACRMSISATEKPGNSVLFVAESEEAYDELHYDSVYTHDICELLDGRVEVQRFIARHETR
jgi:hypothetical protein